MVASISKIYMRVSRPGKSLANLFRITLLVGCFIRIMLEYLVDALSIALSCALHFYTVASSSGPFPLWLGTSAQKAWHSSSYSRKLHQ